ncbi:Cysteine/histidine-rich C1 domain protein [Thalictrum thalictroides]|uniref:Cysteine/histidine-rich C1 domain protein n=1 Tax=Thalictrum thalictroides TaxID=46969 RepID=A0A7J6W1B2_THATH|nr:Cysteine/histidine-rich C1 domain protein [Thalictrum thalictroides]
MALSHFSHKHPLLNVSRNSDFICDGCSSYGFDSRYECRNCNFDLHEFCATCPKFLSSYMHPEHRLVFQPKLPDSMIYAGLVAICDVCEDVIEGFFYTCKGCEFHVHPLCSQVPQHLDHPIDPKHLLEFQLGPPSCCNTCSEMCGPLSYRCGSCNIDICFACVVEDDEDDDEYYEEEEEEVIVYQRQTSNLQTRSGQNANQRFTSSPRPGNYNQSNQRPNPRSAPNCQSNSRTNNYSQSRPRSNPSPNPRPSNILQTNQNQYFMQANPTPFQVYQAIPSQLYNAGSSSMVPQANQSGGRKGRKRKFIFKLAVRLAVAAVGIPPIF